MRIVGDVGVLELARRGDREPGLLPRGRTGRHHAAVGEDRRGVGTRTGCDDQRRRGCAGSARGTRTTPRRCRGEPSRPRSRRGTGDGPGRSAVWTMIVTQMTQMWCSSTCASRFSRPPRSLTLRMPTAVATTTIMPGPSRSGRTVRVRCGSRPSDARSDGSPVRRARSDRRRLGHQEPLSVVARRARPVRPRPGSVSTPSATTSRSSPWARSIIALTMWRSWRRRGRPPHQRTVDLDSVDLDVAERAERRVAGAEVVDRDPHARRPQLVEDRRCPLGVGRQRALGDLDLESIGWEAALS